jgi:hypothetical protein
MIGNAKLNSAARESRDDVKYADRNWNLIDLILTKKEHRKINGSLHPLRAAVHRAFRGWKTAALPISFDAASAGRFAGFTFLYKFPFSGKTICRTAITDS